jgi:hypothetical protein
MRGRKRGAQPGVGHPGAKRGSVERVGKSALELPTTLVIQAFLGHLDSRDLVLVGLRVVYSPRNRFSSQR